MNKIICFLIFLIMVLSYSFNGIQADAATASVSATKPANVAVKQSAPSPIIVNPVDVVNNPSKYLNKTIAFNAEFIAYTSLGLDYKPAFRDSSKYIGILIQRSDVKDHIIPLSEMKIFLTRELAEKYVDLDQGDKIKITGIVFSNALGDPWVEIKTFNVLTQKNKEKNEK